MSGFGRRLGRKQANRSRDAGATFGTSAGWVASSELAALEAHLEAIGHDLLKGYAEGIRLGAPASVTGAVLMEGSAVRGNDTIGELVVRAPTGPNGVRYVCAAKEDIFTIVYALAGESALKSIADDWTEEAPKGVLPIALVSSSAAAVTCLLTGESLTPAEAREACGWVLDRFAPRLVGEARRQMREEGAGLDGLVGMVFAEKRPHVAIVAPRSELIARLQTESFTTSKRTVEALRRPAPLGWMYSLIVGHEGGLTGMIPVAANALSFSPSALTAPS